ncbi:MAG TPA: hypothetical protein VF521_07885 [Pyrinomonadaceae bacterium]
MKRLLLTVPAVVALAFAAHVLPRASAQEEAAAAREARARDEWVLKSLQEMHTVKACMTRGDLLKVFAEEGGLSTRRQRTYVYKGCRYFKVDVKFEPVGGAEERLAESPDDRVVEISKPYVDYGVLD